MNRNSPPAIKEPSTYELQLKPYELFTLNNNVPVYCINAGEQDVLQVEFVFYAGNSYEERNGVSAATNYLLKNGTHTRNALELNEAFEYYGSYLNRACYNETAVVSLHTISKHLDKLLPVLRDIFTESIFPEEELNTYKQNSKQRLSVNLKKGEFIAGRLIDVYLYGKDHPYAKFMDAPDYDDQRKEEIEEFYKKNYVNGNCAIFIAGKIPEHLIAQLNKNFGDLSWKKPDFKTPDFVNHPAEQKKFIIENDPLAVQGAIRIASHFPNRHHPDFKKIMVLNTVFGGYFGSRLMNNIREDKGYTYGIYSYLQNHIKQSAWVISTEVGKDVCEAAINEIYKEMELLREEEVPADELSLVRNYMIGSILGDLDGAFHIMAKWKSIILNGLDMNYFNESVEVIKTIDAVELKHLANKYLRPDGFYELVVY